MHSSTLANDTNNFSLIAILTIVNDTNKIDYAIMTIANCVPCRISSMRIFSRTSLAHFKPNVMCHIKNACMSALSLDINIIILLTVWRGNDSSYQPWTTVSQSPHFAEHGEN